MITLLRLAWVFLKIGTFSFGGGLVIIPLVEQEVVTEYGWLTKTEFMDAVTLGQITPGPIIVSATFIGYRAYGIPGAIVSTVSVILPSFLMICLATQAIRKFHENRILAAFLRGARIAVIGLVVEAAVSMGHGSLVDSKTVLIAAVSITCAYVYRMNPVWILLGAAVMGLVT